MALDGWTSYHMAGLFITKVFNGWEHVRERCYHRYYGKSLVYVEGTEETYGTKKR